MTTAEKPAKSAKKKAAKPRSAATPPAKPDLQIEQTQVFRGPNYFSYDPAIRLVVDLGSLEHWPSNTIPGFNETLLELLPGVGEHSCSRGHAGGFRERKNSDGRVLSDDPRNRVHRSRSDAGDRHAGGNRDRA